jgi:hypothetical protein
VEAQAANTPVCLGIAAGRAGKHNVKHKEGQKNAQHSNKLQHRNGRNVAVFFLFCRLNKSGDHHAKAKEIADVGEVNVKIPTDRADVVKNSKAGDEAYETKRAINGLENKLCGSVFNHGLSPFV